MRRLNRETEQFSFPSDRRASHFASRRDMPASNRLLRCVVRTLFCLVTIAFSSSQIERPAAAQTPPAAVSGDLYRASSPTSSNNRARVPIEHVFIIVLENESFRDLSATLTGPGGTLALKQSPSKGSYSSSTMVLAITVWTIT